MFIGWAACILGIGGKWEEVSDADDDDNLWAGRLRCVKAIVYLCLADIGCYLSLSGWLQKGREGRFGLKSCGLSLDLFKLYVRARKCGLLGARFINILIEREANVRRRLPLGMRDEFVIFIGG